ncbi:MAG: SURF1 family protein [Actinomycetota bacterium]
MSILPSVKHSLLSRRWIAGHILITAVVAACVLLGLWQLRRLGERRALNATIVAHSKLAPAPFDQLSSATPSAREADAQAFRVVDAVGTYDRAREVATSPRSQPAGPGPHVLTPLVTRKGLALLVDRGSVPLDAPRDAGKAPAGEVRVRGLLLTAERPSRFGGGSTWRAGTPLRRIDPALVRPALAYPVYPLFLRLETQDPSQPGGLPAVPPRPALDEGPHFSYAVQWFLFASVALVGYAVILRKELRRAAQDGSDWAEGSAPGGI